MSQHAYFPGCVIESQAVGYGATTREVCRLLDFNLIDIGEWSCCSPGADVAAADLAAYSVAARNLALAESAGGGKDLVTPCGLCQFSLERANVHLAQYPRLKSAVDEALAAGGGGVRYRGGVRVRHLLNALISDGALDRLPARRKRPLRGLKVAPYYGCHATRSRDGLDDPAEPRSLHRWLEALGATVVPFSLQAECCGGSLIMSEEDRGQDILARLLGGAESVGAQCIACVCPLCQVNLDGYQGRIGKRLGRNFNLPALHFMQLTALALGLSTEAAGLKKNSVPAERVLSGT